MIHAGQVGSYLFGLFEGGGEIADIPLVGAAGLGLVGSILVISQEPDTRLTGQTCVALDTGLVMGHGGWTIMERAKHDSKRRS